MTVVFGGSHRAAASACTASASLAVWTPVAEEFEKYQTFAVLEFINTFGQKRRFDLFAVPPARAEEIMNEYRAGRGGRDDGFSIGYNSATAARMTLLVRRLNSGDTRYDLFLMEAGDRLYPAASAIDVPLALDFGGLVPIPFPGTPVEPGPRKPIRPRSGR